MDMTSNFSPKNIYIFLTFKYKFLTFGENFSLLSLYQKSKLCFSQIFDLWLSFLHQAMSRTPTFKLLLLIPNTNCYQSCRSSKDGTLFFESSTPAMALTSMEGKIDCVWPSEVLDELLQWFIIDEFVPPIGYSFFNMHRKPLPKLHLSNDDDEYNPLSNHVL